MPIRSNGASKIGLGAHAATGYRRRQGDVSSWAPASVSAVAAGPGLWFQWDYADGPLVDGPKSYLWCAWLAWSRFRVVLPIRDKTLPRRTSIPRPRREGNARLFIGHCSMTGWHRTAPFEPLASLVAWNSDSRVGRQEARDTRGVLIDQYVR